MLHLRDWLPWCYAVALAAWTAAPELPDAQQEYAAAVAAEACADWDAALLHYENIYDSTPTTPAERVRLRRKFLELRPKVQPNTDPARAGVWKVKLLVFRRLELERSVEGETRRITNEYSAEDIQAIDAATAGFARHVWEHTLGNLRIEWDTTVIEEPLREFHGWPAPEQCASFFARLAPGECDCVMVYMNSEEAGEWSLWGGTLGRLSEAKGAMYIGFNDTRDGLSRDPLGEVQLHEWLHTVHITTDEVQGYPAGLMVSSDCGGECSGVTGLKCFEGAPDQGAPGWMPLYYHLLDGHLTRRMWRELSVVRPSDNVWIRQFCREFLVLGPFEGAGDSDGYGLDQAFIDEENAAPRLQIQSAGRAWERVEAQGRTLDLVEHYGPLADRAAYLAVDVRSSEAREVQVRIGSDDSCKLWQDGRLLLRVSELRGVAADQSIVEARLKAGSNLFLLKVCNADGGWAACFRVSDTAGQPVPGVEYALPGARH